MKIFRGVVLLVLLTALLSCDAPHLNPLDPFNDGYGFGQLSGNVVDINRAPIKEVRVIFKNSNTVAVTDDSGNFKMEDVPLRNSWLYYEGSGFEKDSIEVKWNDQKSKNVGQKILYSATGEIEGTVINSDKEPIAGVKVIFQNTYITETDGLGQFTMRNLPRSDGALYFEKDGYGKHSLNIQWGGQRKKNLDQITLEYAIGQIEGTVFNADKFPISGVRVIFKNSYFGETDVTGLYRLNNLPLSDGMVYFEKEGFLRDSAEVKWGGQKIKVLGQKTLIYTSGQLEGAVYNSAGVPINGVKVIFNNTYVSYSDGAGLYRLYNLPISNGILYFEKDGYKKDSLEVVWAGQKVKTLGQKTLVYSIGQLEGTVYNTVGVPINGVKVIFNNTYVSYTDGTGFYRLSNIPISDGIVYFEKDGYKKDSLEVKWNGQQIKPLGQKTLINSIGKLEGTVYNITGVPISGVKVIFNNAYVSYTDGTGLYRLSNLPISDGILYFEKDGYKKDSLDVKWSGQETKTLGQKTLAYSIGNIEGFVFNPQRIGIAGARVAFKNSYLAQSDAAGQFKLLNVPMGDGWLHFEKSGFAKDSIFVQWAGEKNKQFEVKLNYIAGLLDGYVKQDVNHNLPLSGVRVLWKNQNIITYSDKDGYYGFKNLSHLDGMIYFEKDGYNNDSLFVRWSSNNEGVRVSDRFLNAIPTLDYIAIFSLVENKYGSSQRYSMTINAAVTDIDDYIDSVIVRCSALGFYKRLRFNSTSEMYEYTELNMYSVDEAVGKNFEVLVKDKSKRTYFVGSSTVKRVISQIVDLTSPKSNAVVNTKPTFVWKRFTLGFNFKYKFQIYTNVADLPSELVYEKSNISKDDIQLTLDFDLKAGNYYWVIWCVDDYQNAARSEPASFIVQ